MVLFLRQPWRLSYKKSKVSLGKFLGDYLKESEEEFSKETRDIRHRKLLHEVQEPFLKIAEYTFIKKNPN